jgi:hydrogenase maturation protease
MELRTTHLQASPPAYARARVLVLGVGNVLLSDEGVGIHLLRRVTARLASQSDVVCLDGGTLSFELTPWIAAADALIVLDAAQLRQWPGAVQCLEGQAFDAFLGQRARTVHDVGLRDLLDMARLLEALPRRRALIGIQPAVIDWGDGLSADVEAACASAGDTCVSLVESWLTEPVTAAEPTSDENSACITVATS